MEVINEIVWNKVRPTFTLSSREKLVEIDSKIEQLDVLLDVEANDVLAVGIWGTGGIGKTTITRLVYERISHRFEVCTFRSNVREVAAKHGIVNIQKQLLSPILKEKITQVWGYYGGSMMVKNCLWNKKVLLVLDDVDQLEQLELLVGDKRWFGVGSRIIITTRDLRFLVSHDVEIKQFELMGLSEDKALQLISWHAFKNDPNDEYLELLKAFVKYAAKLPLTLKTLGIFLCGRDQGAWTSTLDKLKKDPEETTFKTLLVSYGGLDDMTKNVFLDVACFHKGNDKDTVIEILDCCDFSGRIGIDVLVEKSLLYISGKNVEMHDLVQEMAWKIVRRKSKEPARRSQLWLREDIFHVLKNNTGTEDIEGIVLHLPKCEEAHCNFEAFSKMYNLKMIQFNLLFLSPGSEVLPNSLRFLEWRYYPSKSLPLSFELDSLTVLSLPTCEIVQLWNGRKRLSNLKHMDLSFSKLIRTPYFTEIQNLERLVLEGCYDLIEIHPSIAALKRLKILNFKNCMSMKSLPSEIAMESLEFLSLSRCVNLKKIPEFVGDMKNLSRLILSETAIKEIPPSIGCLIGLVELHLDGCQSLLCVPSVISNCKSLKLLNMLGCSKLSKLPESLGVMDYLEELDLSRTALKELPS